MRFDMSFERSGRNAREEFEAALNARASREAEKVDAEFQEVIGSVSASREELSAMLSLPEFSLPQVKQLFAGLRRQKKAA